MAGLGASFDADDFCSSIRIEDFCCEAALGGTWGAVRLCAVCFGATCWLGAGL